MPFGRDQIGEDASEVGRSFMTPDIDLKTKTPLLPVGWGLTESPILAKSPRNDTYVPRTKGDTQNGDMTNGAQPEIQPLMVAGIDMCIASNTKKHTTNLYELAHDRCVPPDGDEVSAKLIVRRGETFNIKLKFDREYDPKLDDLQIILQFGDRPKVSKGTNIVIDVGDRVMQNKWCATATHVKGVEEEDEGKDGTAAEKWLHVAINTPGTTFVGRWKMSIQTSRKSYYERELQVYSHPDIIYILFNPWCKADQVYIDDEDERDEYICNDVGKIFTGNYRQITSKPWSFGQFEDFVLDLCLDLLDRANLNVTVRNSAVHMVRAIAAATSGSPTDSVMQGSWSGKYCSQEGDDVVAPPSWVSSLSILEKYMAKKEAVKYGQCWVFAGIVTTLCRSIGLPCRCVTCFSAAHDCDGSTSIDMHWHHNGKPLNELNEDTIWDFHVWNEVWITRPELGPNCNGWQAMDATPQQTSEGLFQAGPFPVAAIQRGEVNMPFQGNLFFAEVNADTTHWVLQENNTWKYSIVKHRIGLRVSTKMPRGTIKKDQVVLRYAREGPIMDDPEREDITSCYKQRLNTEQERSAAYKAKLKACHPGSPLNTIEDVSFSLEQKDYEMVGNNFYVTIIAKNHSRHCRTLHGTMTLYTAHYTGVRKSLVKMKVFDMCLDPIKGAEAVMRLAADDYQHLLTDQSSFQVQVTAHIDETNQYYTDCDVFRLRRPFIYLEMAWVANVGVGLPCTLRFTNPMPTHLTNCEWQIEGTGVETTRYIKHPDIDPYGLAEIKLTLFPLRPGHRMVVCSFQSRELMDVTGNKELWIT